MPFRPPRAPCARPGDARRAPSRLLLLLAALAALAAGCGRLGEPARDDALIAALESLAAATDAFWAGVEAAPDAVAPARDPAYAALGAEADAVAATARARQPEAGEGPYAVATAGFMADYRRQVARLAAHDAARAAIGLPPAAPVLALRRAAMRDAVDDALFYERGAPDRTAPLTTPDRTR